MIKRYWLLLPIVAIMVFAAANQPTNNSIKKEEILLDAILAGLKKLHYQPQDLDDEFSKKVFDLYLKRLDSNKRFYLASDIKKLSPYEHLIDNEIQNGTYKMFSLSIDLFNNRIGQIQEFYKQILSEPFDLNKEETFESDPDKRGYPKTEIALKEIWRKTLKYQVMTRVSDKLEAQKDKDASEQKSIEELEAAARQKVLKTHDDWFHRLERLKREDRVSDYLNAITAAYDPHTNYYPPKDKEDFDIRMSGRLEGIGATLTEDGVYTKVVNIIAGGPAWKEGTLEENDLIIAVAQGEEEPVDVVDMATTDVVKYIRGKKGTEVRLTVKKKNGSTQIIPIIRDVVIIDESYAKSVILTDDEFDGKKIGYINLPQFYADFTNSGGRSCAKDVKNELTKLKAENIDGVILDLRNNGGGSLRDVVDMSGLFIDKGPIVQVKSRGERPYILKDKDPNVHYNGPVVILVNNYSASASEIMAAALQDYGRAIVVGSPSFGKGTVQRFLDLDNVVSNSFADIKPLGSVKLTIQKFYRINGKTTQLKGVTPDIILPDAWSYIEVGEKEEDHPMEWDEIAAVDYGQMDNLKKIKKIKKASQERVESNDKFALIEERAHLYKTRRDETILNLNINKFKAEGDAYEAKTKKFDAINTTIEGLNVQTLKADANEISSDESKQARRESWYKNIKKDAYIDEAIAIINDLME